MEATVWFGGELWLGELNSGNARAYNCVGPGDAINVHWPTNDTASWASLAPGATLGTATKATQAECTAFCDATANCDGVTYVPASKACVAFASAVPQDVSCWLTMANDPCGAENYNAACLADVQAHGSLAAQLCPGSGEAGCTTRADASAAATWFVDINCLALFIFMPCSCLLV